MFFIEIDENKKIISITSTNQNIALNENQFEVENYNELYVGKYYIDGNFIDAQAQQ